ncbi:unnamed protein product [Mycena citricolor]|uniref:Uncharacterized protein n=1 Tax=Mycena citricolor TaxID=2018698 RepID=A0AAD2Q2J0_9AGAR|nr:unnamed protein product [Mycena citricolor]
MAADVCWPRGSLLYPSILGMCVASELSPLRVFAWQSRVRGSRPEPGNLGIFLHRAVHRLLRLRARALRRRRAGPQCMARRLDVLLPRLSGSHYTRGSRRSSRKKGWRQGRPRSGSDMSGSQAGLR